MLARREVQVVSLSFLDVISCGFGALILLLALTRIYEPVIIERSRQDLDQALNRLEQELAVIQGETRELNREMLRRQDTLESKQNRLDRLRAQLAALNRIYESSADSSSVSEVIEDRLALARQSLTEEMKRLLASYKRDPKDNTIGGVPVDSEYVIFIIDTSGSMFNFAWPLVLQKLEETLEVYPNLKGIQVMNDEGGYMFTQYADRWIPDTPARRQAIIKRLSTWNAFSNSSPVEGIIKAIATFYKPGRKISLYVFGDDFTGRSIQHVIETVDRINREDEKGNRLVRIHGVGFPVQFANPQQYQEGGYKFSVLMRILCNRNGGTFVGLPRFEP